MALRRPSSGSPVLSSLCNVSCTLAVPVIRLSTLSTFAATVGHDIAQSAIVA